jgi:chlorite dismutase
MSDSGATVTADTPTRAATARHLNAQIRYVMYSVFRSTERIFDGDRPAIVAEAERFLADAQAGGVETRGAYDLTGLRAGADFLMWWAAPTIEALQATYSGFRRTALGRASAPVWSASAVHRPAEFNKNHIPAYLAEEEPGTYLCVYPFVRSLEWYLLEPADRRSQLAEHGRMARDYPDVRANTVAAFALGDYEWILALEAHELHRIVDLMRHLRGSTARRHTREEVPFFTGRRRSLGEIVATLP